jgi:hypothetical protein
MINKGKAANIRGIWRGAPRVPIKERLTMWLVWSPCIINGVLVTLWAGLTVLVLLLSLCRHLVSGDIGWSEVMHLVSELKCLTLRIEGAMVLGSALLGAWLLSGPSQHGREFSLTAFRQFVINSVMTKHLHIFVRDEREDTISLR